MRKFIIDTDTGSDDAAALMTAALNPDIEILGVTVAAGNVDLKQAADNALMTLEICGSDAPVFLGAKQPLLHARRDTVSVHGKDGMGDCGIIHPAGKARSEKAVEFILNQVEKYPDEVEILTLGPVTDIALAILTDREIMSRVKHIWSMGTSGFGIGNATPVSEFNVYIDAEAYAIMLDSGIPVTVIGYDLCTENISLNANDLEILKNGTEKSAFLERATSKLLEFNIKARGNYLVDLPDAIAAAAALWDGFITESIDCFGHCCTEPGHAYGQVIFYQKGRTYEAMPKISSYNACVVTKVDEEMFKRRFIGLLTDK